MRILIKVLIKDLTEVNDNDIISSYKSFFERFVLKTNK